MELNLQKPLAFIDIEATGLNPAKDRIVEISIVKAMPDGKEHVKTYKVNPGIPISQEAIDIHGISNEDVKSQPPFSEIAKKIFIFLDDCDLAGYNSNRFDIPMLLEEFHRAEVDFSLDGRKLIDVQRIFHLMEKRTLGAAYKFFCNKELEGAHGAEADAVATFEVLKGQLDKYKDVLNNDVEFLENFCKEEDFIDIGRRMVKRNNEAVFNFGKHKGETVKDVLTKEPQYYDWIMKGDFLQHTKQKLKEIKLTMNQ